MQMAKIACEKVLFRNEGDFLLLLDIHIILFSFVGYIYFSVSRIMGMWTTPMQTRLTAIPASIIPIAITMNEYLDFIFNKYAIILPVQVPVIGKGTVTKGFIPLNHSIVSLLSIKNLPLFNHLFIVFLPSHFSLLCFFKKIKEEI